MNFLFTKITDLTVDIIKKLNNNLIDYYSNSLNEVEWTVTKNSNDSIIIHPITILILLIINSSNIIRIFLTILITKDIILTDILLVPLLIIAIYMQIKYQRKTVLHYFLPLKLSRVSIINEFHNSRFTINTRRHYWRTTKEDNFKYNNEIISIFPKYENLEDWIELNISSSKAIKNLFVKRLNKNHYPIKYNPLFLLWSKIIPLNKLNDHEKLELLKRGNIGIESSSIDFFAYKNNGFLKFLNDDCAIIENCFSEYTSKDIMKLFSSNYTLQDYKNIIKNYTLNQKDFEGFPKFKTMRELQKYVLNYTSIKFPFSKELLEVEGDYQLGRIRAIKSYKELTKAASYFKNCAKTYKYNAQSGTNFFFILTINNDFDNYEISHSAHNINQQDIIFDINNKFLLNDAKHPLNKELDSKTLNKLIGIIRLCKNKGDSNEK